MESKIIEFDAVKSMLGDDPEYMKEFCKAAVTSFTEFRNDYTTGMHNRDLEELKRAGHKIRPAAQMIGAEVILTEYKNGKELLKNNTSDKQVNGSIQKQQQICDEIISDFNRQINQC